MRRSVPATSEVEPGSATEGWLARRGPLLLCLAALLPLLVPVLDPAVQLYYRDTLRLYYPVKRFIADQLALGRLPLWDPWTESGTSLLGQLSPGLLHPLTLLYAALPFDLAFKLNHLVALPLAAGGAYALARRLPVSRPAAAMAGIGYAGSGYLLSMTASNLPYALGAATLPWAVAGALFVCEQPSAWRLFWGAAPLALCAVAGEPQSALFGGLLGGLLALALPLAGPDSSAPPQGAPPLRAFLPRRAALCAAWGAVALLLAAPALLPAAERAARTRRLSGLGAEERAAFELPPLRLLGMLLPRTFDNLTIEGPAHEPAAGDYTSTGTNPFVDSNGLGAPVLLLALVAALLSRRGRWLSAAALLFALGACGQRLGVYGLVFAHLPGMGLFRYAEKLLGPSALLFSVAAALGAEAALAGGRKAAGLLASVCGGALGLLAGARLAVGLLRGPLEAWLLTAGRAHDPQAPAAFVTLLGDGLLTAAALCAGLGLVALHRFLSPRGPALSPLLAACCSAAAMLTYGADLLQTAARDLASEPPPFAAGLARRGGAAPGQGRILIDNTEDLVLHLDEPDGRLRGAISSVRLLRPQLDALHFESAQAYFSLKDPAYAQAMARATMQFARLFGVRFLARLPGPGAPPTEWPAGLEVRELETGPRAFLIERVVTPPPGHGVAEVFADGTFEARKVAVVTREESERLSRAGLQRGSVAATGSASLSRPGPDRLAVEVDAQGGHLVVIGEHFDPGWSATLDGEPAPVVAADGLALGVYVPSGRHRLLLRFRPPGLVPGLALAVAALLALTLAGLRERRLLAGSSAAA